MILSKLAFESIDYLLIQPTKPKSGPDWPVRSQVKYTVLLVEIGCERANNIVEEEKVPLACVVLFFTSKLFPMWTGFLIP